MQKEGNWVSAETKAWGIALGRDCDSNFAEEGGVAFRKTSCPCRLGPTSDAPTNKLSNDSPGSTLLDFSGLGLHRNAGFEKLLLLAISIRVWLGKALRNWKGISLSASL